MTNKKEDDKKNINNVWLKIKAFCGILPKVAKDEMQEVLNLTPTPNDYKQAESIARIAVAALGTCGVAIPAFAQDIIEKSAAYQIRNLKDGLADNEKLIIVRIVNEIKKL